ncbi:MAG: hypothetical protein QOE90_3216 [Thermoplasmata archaeon]|jgi:hypothetical protein|nr:hypothetical protein [Thermoplasmata archaeon]
MQPVPLEGTQGEVRAALAIRREALHRLAMHFGLPPAELLQRAAHGRLPQHGPALVELASQRKASWWLQRRDLAPHALLGAPMPSRPAHAPDLELPPGHPKVGVAVVSRTDGLAPRLAQAVLRAAVPRAMEVARAAETPQRQAPPLLDETLRAHGVSVPDEPPRSIAEAACAEVVVQVGDVPRLPESYRGKRIHLWRVEPERPASLQEARFVYGQLTQQAHCLVDEYRKRLHRPT